MHTLIWGKCLKSNESSELRIGSIVGVPDYPTFLAHVSRAWVVDDSIPQEDLSQLVVEVNSDGERERWYSEVGEGDVTSTKTDVEPGDVGKNGYEDGLEAQSKVSEVVDHELLRKGQVP